MLALRIFAAGSLALAAGAALAAAVPLAAKPGLWQMTVHMSGDAMYPPSVMARMTPAQKAQMLAEMNKPVTMKQCVTAEQLQMGLDISNAGHTNCTRTVLASSATSLTYRVECKGAHVTSSGTSHLEFTNPGVFRGASDMSITMNGHAAVRKSTVEGAWLSADCGHVKPGQPE